MIGSALAAIRNSGDLPHTLDSISTSHTINSACFLFNASCLEEMDMLWNQNVSQSPATWHAYELFIGRPCPRFRVTNQVSWVDKWEMWRDLFVNFTKIGDFLRAEGRKKRASNTVGKLAQLFTKPSQTFSGGFVDTNSDYARYHYLYFELAVVVAYGRPMCEAMKFFEQSKDMVVPFAREKIKEILDLRMASDLPPKVMDVIATFHPEFESIELWQLRRDVILAPVLTFLEKKFAVFMRPVPTNLKPKTNALCRYRLARLFSFAELLRPDRFLEWYAAVVTRSNEDRRKDENVFADSLRNLLADLPFASSELVDGLISQLVEMRMVAETANTRYKASNLWGSFWMPLENIASVSWWYYIAARVSIIPMNTADVDRVSSVFSDVVGEEEQANMETIEATVITRYNNLTPNKIKHPRFSDELSDREGD